MSDSCQPYFSLRSSLFDTFAAEKKYMMTMKKSKLLTAMVILWALISCAEISAQEIQQVSNDSIALQEVVVKAARVVNKEDGKLIFPSDIQKQRS